MPAEIWMDMYDGEDPGETVEDSAKQQHVIFSRIEQSQNCTIKILVKARLRLATSEDATSRLW